MKVKDTTGKDIKRAKAKKPPRIPTATVKRTAARAGHGAVSSKAVPHIRDLYTKKLREISPKLKAILEMTGKKTAKSKDVKLVFSARNLAGILSATA
jgi:histone H3/H4